MSEGYDRKAAPDINPDQELRQIFVAAVVHAFRSKNFLTMAFSATPGTEADKIFDDILKENEHRPFYPRLAAARTCFTSKLVNHWRDIEHLAQIESPRIGQDEIRGVREVAIKVANEAISCLRTQPARLVVVKT